MTRNLTVLTLYLTILERKLFWRMYVKRQSWCSYVQTSLSLNTILLDTLQANNIRAQTILKDGFDNHFRYLVLRCWLIDRTWHTYSCTNWPWWTLEHRNTRGIAGGQFTLPVPGSFRRAIAITTCSLPSSMIRLTFPWMSQPYRALTP